MNYKEQLETEMWHSKRCHIFNLRGKQCMCCCDKNNLNIHHIKYTGMAWEAPDEDLICLCNKCHNKVHDNSVEYFNNETCVELINNYNIKENAIEQAHIEFINYIKLDFEYLEKDLKLVVKQLGNKYNVNINLNTFKNAYCETLDKSLYFNKIKIGKNIGYTIEYID